MRAELRPTRTHVLVPPRVALHAWCSRSRPSRPAQGRPVLRDEAAVRAVGREVEPDRRRCQRPRLHLPDRGRSAGLRRAARPRPVGAGDGDRAHRDLRGRQRHVRRLRELRRPRAGRPGVASRRRSRRRRTTRWWRCSPPSPPSSTRTSPPICSPFLRGRARRRPRPWAGVQRRRSCRCAPATAHIHPEPRIGVDYFTSDAPGHWRRAAVGGSPVALGARWGSVRPFVLERGSQFRTPPPPAMASAEYTAAFDEVQAPGRRRPGHADRADRRADAHRHLLGLRRHAEPVRPAAAVQPDRRDDRRAQGTSARRARPDAGPVATAMADAGIAIWESKYFYDLWRPITGIREADAGTGPTGGRRQSAHQAATPAFIPLGAPSSNLAGPEFHAAVSVVSVRPRRIRRRRVRAAAQLLRARRHRLHVHLRRVQRRDASITPASFGRCVPRTFDSLSQAEEENGQSRSTSASIGRSTRPRASRKAGRWPTTSIAHCSARQSRQP